MTVYARAVLSDWIRFYSGTSVFIVGYDSYNNICTSARDVSPYAYIRYIQHTIRTVLNKRGNSDEYASRFCVTTLSLSSFAYELSSCTVNAVHSCTVNTVRTIPFIFSYKNICCCGKLEFGGPTSTYFIKRLL